MKINTKMNERISKVIRKTKIIVTLGESSSSKEKLIDLINAGMDIARISSRFLKIDKQEVLKNLKEAMEETGTQVAIMVGLRESDIRIGSHKQALRLNKGDIVHISSSAEEGEKSNSLWCNNIEFPSLVSPGDKLLLDFGKIILTVLANESLDTGEMTKSRSSVDLDYEYCSTGIDSSKVGNIMFMLNTSQKIEKNITNAKPGSGTFQRPKRLAPKKQKSAKTVICRAENDCIITNLKPVHISSANNSEMPMSEATVPEDFKLLEWADENNVDFIVFKQVRNNEDLDFLLKLSAANAKKFLGLQNKNSLGLFEDFMNLCDGVVIGRGTLALETSLADVCRIQKKVVHRCNEMGRPVVISTQLLDSMILNNAPTRSEVTDITNAVLDGADALLLCGETAYGIDPMRAVAACSRICMEAERHLDYTNQCENIKQMLGPGITITENTCYSAVTTVICTHAKVIVCLTESGRTAQIISRFLPPCTIVALTNSQRTCRQMKIIRGVAPFFVTEVEEGELQEKIFDIVKTYGFAQNGDDIVLVGGLLHNFAAGNTCSLKILTVK